VLRRPSEPAGLFGQDKGPIGILSILHYDGLSFVDRLADQE
jgi:hypothetical protein